MRSNEALAQDPSVVSNKKKQMKILDNNDASGYDSADYMQTDWIERELFPHKYTIKKD